MEVNGSPTTPRYFMGEFSVITAPVATLRVACLWRRRRRRTDISTDYFRSTVLYLFSTFATFSVASSHRISATVYAVVEVRVLSPPYACARCHLPGRTDRCGAGAPSSARDCVGIGVRYRKMSRYPHLRCVRRYCIVRIGGRARADFFLFLSRSRFLLYCRQHRVECGV